MARIAKSLATLRDQVNAKWPNRSKASDGWIGDSKHSSRKSDHNPNKSGVVCALDITHDMVHGIDASKLAEAIRSSGDPRLGYVISNGRIANPSIQNGMWRKYSGTNAHTKHFHISVKQVPSHYDNTAPWKIDGVVTAPETAVPVVVPKVAPLLKKGAKGEEVKRLQKALNDHGAKLNVDGDFGKLTVAAVIAFQKARKLTADGKVGPKTWAELDKKPAPLPVQTDWPAYAKKFFKETVGLSDLAASAFVASLIWESGGNQKHPYTIKWDAIGDGGNSYGAGQWNKAAGRRQGLLDLAAKRGTSWTDPDTQLNYAWQELRTTEKRAYAALMDADTIEEANTAAIKYWRPGVPHADRRLAIAKSLG